MTSQQQNQAGVVDPLDLLDFSEYDGLPYQSPSVSPPTTGKAQFARPSQMTTTPPTLPSSQIMSGPSHQYDQYKQQTPFVPGALASTIAVNQNNADITGYNLEYMSPADEIFDFNSAPSQGSGNADMDVDFESPEAGFFFDATINPNAIGGPDSQLQGATVPSQASNMGRMYPGMHQQAALAKAQAQQRQQQQLIQQQQQQRQNPQAKQQRSKAPMPSDPIVEQKITQLLNSMRSKSTSAGPEDDSAMMHIAKTKKEEEDMDEDERLLASEEGKKLSSKERRQLRNKVSARAFRSRRKEYIGQLESEIANKVSENGDLRAQNRALMEENRRLSDLSRMLLSSPAFSNFLDNLSSNPAPVPQMQQQQMPKMEQQQTEVQQLPKDINPYAIAQQTQPRQIGMAMIPEQTMDFSMLNMESDTFSYQPRVFSVLETPEVPQIDVAVLSGKTSTVDADIPSVSEEKMSAPVIEAPVCPTLEKPQTPKAPLVAPANLDGDIYDDEVSSSIEPVFEGVNLEKACARYELITVSDEATSSMALRRVEQLSASLEATLSRLEMMTIGL